MDLDLQDGGLRGSARWPPLYEAKMINQFDRRWATYDGADTAPRPRIENRDVVLNPRPATGSLNPRSMHASPRKGWDRGWLMGWRHVCRSHDLRTMIGTVIPTYGCDHTYLLIPQRAAKQMRGFSGKATVGDAVPGYEATFWL